MIRIHNRVEDLRHGLVNEGLRRRGEVSPQRHTSLSNPQTAPFATHRCGGTTP